MNRQQLALIFGSVALVAILFFGFDTKPPKHALIEKSRAEGVALEETQNILREAKKMLPGDTRRYLQSLENVAGAASDDTVRVDAYRRLSAEWFAQGNFILAGYFAELIAGIEQSAESWAVSGKTYAAALNGEGALTHLDLATEGATRCYENAISLDPENIEYRVGLAVCYAEYPPADNPMIGVQLLLELNRTHPENTSVLFQLARLAMQTGQYPKAEERLESALALQPDERRLNCLMVELLRATQRAEQAEPYAQKCAGN